MHPQGRLDVAVAPAFRDQMKHLLDGGSTRLVIDLGEVTFIDSSGLGTILVVLKLARRAGGDVRIVSPPQQFMSLLRLTSLNRVLPVYSSVEEALVDFD
jgi:anti-anti-sigma factor